MTNEVTMIKNVILAVVGIAIAVGLSLHFAPKAVVAPKVGALVGPDLPYPYIGVGGVQTYFGSTGSLNQASTTLCALQSPNATSTLIANRSGVNLKVSSTTAMLVTISNSSNTGSSTTILATSTIAANAQGFVFAATTTPLADSTLGRLTLSNLLFAPNAWLVVSASGGGGTFSPTGQCSAAFEVVQN